MLMGKRAKGTSRSTFWLCESRIAVPILVVTAVILRLPDFNRSLWHDEVLYSTNYHAATLSQIWHFFLVNPCAPLHRTFMFFWDRVFGDSELAVRLPAMLFGVAAVWLIYEIAKRFGRGGMPFLVGLLLCFSPAHVWYSQEATPYAMATCFLLATILVWFQFGRTTFHWVWYLVYSSLLLAAVFAHYFVAVFLLPLTVLSLSLEKPVRVRIISINIVVGFCIVLALAAKFTKGNLISGMGFLRPFTVFEWWMAFFNWFLHGNCLWTINPYKAAPGYLSGNPALLVFQLVFFGLFLAGFWFDHRKAGWPQSRELGFYLLGLPSFMFLLTLLGYDRLYIERYVLMLLPFFIMIMARGATRFSNLWVKGFLVCGLIGMSVASYAMLLHKDTTWTVYKHNPDWRSTAAYLEQREGFAESIIMAATPPDALKYYLLKHVPEESLHIGDYDERQLTLMLSRGLIRQVYLVKNLYWAGKFDMILERVKRDKRLKPVDFQSFKGVEVYAFAPQL